MAVSFGPKAACSRKRTASAAVVGCAAGIVLADAAGGAGGAAPGGGLVAAVVVVVVLAVIGGTALPPPPPLPRQPASGRASASAATVAGSPAPGWGARGRLRAGDITCSSRSARGADALVGARAVRVMVGKARMPPHCARFETCRSRCGRCPRASGLPRRAGDRVLRSRLIVCFDLPGRPRLQASVSWPPRPPGGFRAAFRTRLAVRAATPPGGRGAAPGLCRCHYDGVI